MGDKLYEIERKTRSNITPLFDGWEETPIWSCLQGIMGRAWTDDQLRPASARIIVGDLCFFAGQPNQALVETLKPVATSGFLILIPRDKSWLPLIEAAYRGKCKRWLRYAVKKEPHVFERDRLEKLAAALPPGYRLEAVGKEIFQRTREEAWARDLCSQFPDYEAYRKSGLGVVALTGDELTAGASSYTVYRGGIEIEVDTKESHRRRGLARACAARLILNCLDRGLYPSWDAHDLRSLALAESLGYHGAGPYETVLIDLSAEHKL